MEEIVVRSEANIKSLWKTSDILCSIACTTYNHINFIEQCINGFLMQETNFPYEIIIYDDASTDGTTDIVSKYAALYPGIIKPIIQTENQKSKGIKPSPTFIYPACRGKYIAKCEGDDYWTDPTKLQKQVEYMEEHPDCVVTGHDAIVINHNNEVVKHSKLPDKYKRDASGEELKIGFWILTLSIVMRNVPIFKNFPQEVKGIKNGDTFLISLLGQYGSYHYIPELKPAVYRVHTGGVWSLEDPLKKALSQKQTQESLVKYYTKINDIKTSKSIANNILEVVNQNIFREATIKGERRIMWLYFFKTSAFFVSRFKFKSFFNNTKALVKKVLFG